MENKTWGFLRETKDKAIAAGLDADTGICRTGLDEYLEVIFPDVNDWVHDKTIDVLPEGIKSKRRPDYRSEQLKMIIEFDGLQHYTSPEKIKKDEEAQIFYEGLGYKVIRIPYFIQLTNKVVKQLFGVDVEIELFDGAIPSMGVKGKNTPAYLCVGGIERMAKEFINFPEQYAVNRDALLDANDEYLTGVNALIRLYNQFKNEK